MKKERLDKDLAKLSDEWEKSAAELETYAQG